MNYFEELNRYIVLSPRVESSEYIDGRIQVQLANVFARDKHFSLEVEGTDDATLLRFTTRIRTIPTDSYARLLVAEANTNLVMGRFSTKASEDGKLHVEFGLSHLLCDLSPLPLEVVRRLVRACAISSEFMWRCLFLWELEREVRTRDSADLGHIVSQAQIM